ncbi:glyceraldehyde 3-phosphate dehydrogenase NAD-binding domain-containing protein, partial [Patescibacteria group bacterium]
MENKKIRVAINGCGRIGRAFLKLAVENENIDVVAVNDLGSIENIAYLLKYDSAYGVSDLEIKTDDAGLPRSARKDGVSQSETPSDDSSAVVSARRNDAAVQKLIVNGKEIKFLQEKNPADLP